MSILVVKDLVKSFGSFVAVNNITVEMAKGEVCTLLGPSGCGKTTTLRCIAGLETFDSGSVSIDGRMVADPANGIFVPPEDRNLGMVFSVLCAVAPQDRRRECIARFEDQESEWPGN